MKTQVLNSTPSHAFWPVPSDHGRMEHRWGQRTAVDIGVRLISGSATMSIGAGRLLNASVSGGLLRTGLRLPFLETVYLVPMSSQRRGDWPEGLRGYVVRATRSGLGVEWCEHLDPEELLALCDVQPVDLASTIVRGSRSHA